MNTATKRIASDRRSIIFMTALIVVCTAGLLAGCAAKQEVNTEAADAEVTRQVEAGLAAESSLDNYKLAVTTDAGRVRLSGLVATETERDTAERVAAASLGVVSVDNHIRFGDPSVGTGASPAL